MKAFFINFITGFFARFSKLKLKSGNEKDMEFKHSAQKIGASQNEKVRNIFRHSWLKLK